MFNYSLLILVPLLHRHLQHLIQQKEILRVMTVETVRRSRMTSRRWYWYQDRLRELGFRN